MLFQPIKAIPRISPGPAHRQPIEQLPDVIMTRGSIMERRTPTSLCPELTSPVGVGFRQFGDLLLPHDHGALCRAPGPHDGFVLHRTRGAISC